jgi:lipid-A-disaccharide synthase
VVIHNRELAIVGIFEILSSLRKIHRTMNDLCRLAVDRKVDCALLIDYPDFNLRLARKLKKAGIPVYHYISPTVWAWRYSRVKLIRKVITRQFIIFPFEVPIFEKEKIPFTYTGHPLVPDIKEVKDRVGVRKQHGVAEGEVMISILPGSRHSEIDALLPVMMGSLEILSRRYKLKLFLIRANNIDEKLPAEYLEKSPLPVTVVTQGEGHDVIAASDAAVTTCGTSNLELALLGVPFVAAYSVNRLSYFFGKPFVRIDRYSIVNILSGEPVVTELIQRDLTPRNMADEVTDILENPLKRETMKKHFLRIKEMLRQERTPASIITEKIAEDLGISKT